MAKKKEALSKEAMKLVKKYGALVKKLGRYPTDAELSQVDVTRNSYRHYFGSMELFREAAKEEMPELFADLFSSEEFTSARFSNTKEALKDVEEFIITTAVAGCKAHTAALDAIDTWMQFTGGLLLVQPVKDPGSKAEFDFFDGPLAAYDFIWKDINLNAKVRVSSILLSAKQLNPHTGLERISQNTGLTIIASPKRRLTPLANMEGQPGYLASGGAITLPEYAKENYMSCRTAAFGYAEHKLGGIYVKVLGKNKYEFTPITFDSKDGHFNINGHQYCADGSVYEVAPTLITFGDLHVEELSDFRRQEFYRILQEEKPVMIDLHDIYCGISCSPFNKRKPELQFLEGRAHSTKTVEEDLRDVGRLLQSASQLVDHINVIDSNHHKFLEFWITSGAYRLGNPADIQFAHRLADAWLSNPETPILAIALRVAGVAIPSNVIFHKSTKPLKFMGIERSQHGHASSNGRPKQLSKLMEEIGSSIIGHTHISQIVGEAWNVGTFSGIADHRPAYALSGPNKWSNSYIRVYEDGQRELVHVFEK